MGLIAPRFAFINWAGFVTVSGKFRHIREAIYIMKFIDLQTYRARKMRFIIAALLTTASLLSPLKGFAESADVEATIKKVDTSNLSLTLDDGKTYQAPEEFDFNGLKAGVKVIVFYTEVDGRRVINDLQVVE